MEMPDLDRDTLGLATLRPTVLVGQSHSLIAARSQAGQFNWHDGEERGERVHRNSPHDRSTPPQPSRHINVVSSTFVSRAVGSDVARPVRLYAFDGQTTM